eukprot:1959544-Alexandrium_andersonii.AAC.1
MAEPEVAKLPFASFPGLSDTSNPIMKACHGAWNELVVMVGPEVINQVAGKGPSASHPSLPRFRRVHG